MFPNSQEQWEYTESLIPGQMIILRDAIDLKYSDERDVPYENVL